MTALVTRKTRKTACRVSSLMLLSAVRKATKNSRLLAALLAHQAERQAVKAHLVDARREEPPEANDYVWEDDAAC